MLFFTACFPEDYYGRRSTLSSIDGVAEFKNKFSTMIYHLTVWENFTILTFRNVGSHNPCYKIKSKSKNNFIFKTSGCPASGWGSLPPLWRRLPQCHCAFLWLFWPQGTVGPQMVRYMRCNIFFYKFWLLESKSPVTKLSRCLMHVLAYFPDDTDSKGKEKCPASSGSQILDILREAMDKLESSLCLSATTINNNTSGE